MSESDQPTLLLIDGHSLAFRAFYALPVDSFTAANGQHTNAIHGFLSMLLLLLQNEKPTHLGVAFDISRSSFRTRDYPEYKGTRSESPPEFSGQVPLLQDALKAMNIPTMTKEDFEADDVIASLAKRGIEEGYRVLLVSGDRDAIQLVNDRVTLLYPSRQGVSDLTRYDVEKVRTRYGIEPWQYPDIAALVGETSDNLPGIDKVGEKTAVKWLNQYGSLEAILANADQIKGVVGNNLREQRDRAERNRRLNRLVDDLELEVGPADLERKPVDVKALRELLGGLQMRNILERILKYEGERGSASSAATPEAVIKEEPSLAPPAPAPALLRGAELAAWLERQTAAHPGGLGLAVELAGDRILGIGVAGETESLTVPWVPGSADTAPFEEWLAGPHRKLMHEAKPQLKALTSAGLPLGGLAFDSQIAAWLLRPSGVDKTLGDVVLRYLNEELPQSDPNQLVPEDDGAGVATQAWFTFRAVDALRGVLDERDTRVLTEIELPTLRVLARMETNGVAVDAPLLASLSGELGERIESLAQEAYGVVGHELNLGSPKQLQQVLFDELGMPKTRKTKSGFSTDADSLADLMETHPHPFVDLLLQHRDASKLRQIIETLERSIGGDGRIHTTYALTGTTTGRISSNDPNLQNIPIRAEEGRKMRAAFVKGDGYETLLTADYSQIEMRIMAHLSQDAGLIEAFNTGEDLHRFVGARVFGVDPADVTPAMRTKVKAMSYGLAYGLSAFGLSKQLRIDTSEARQLMGDYFARFGAVRDYLRNVVEEARADGYTETIFGRRRPFPDLNSPNRVLRDNAERQALNAPIQGSAADIMKLAMIAIDRDMQERELRSRMLLQVHDELVFEVAAGEWDDVEGIVRDRMAHAAELRVPLDVQVGRGDDWDAAAH
ncbi:DNA polymerase I [Naasia sp. SYSU D00948]|uniref:DNA polymerase I n=1 Tax=Naasia sp. SYSU D00948 TaxID=2817379 RepID=UPI001B315E03|nr:DNA polymerase I [Naasia sp. SYSU D00948]